MTTAGSRRCRHAGRLAAALLALALLPGCAMLRDFQPSVEVRPMNAIDMQHFRRHCTDLPQMSDRDAWKQHQLFLKSMYGGQGEDFRIGRDDKFLLSMIGRLASSHDAHYSDRTYRFGQYIAIGLRKRMTPKDAYTFGKQAMTYDEAIEDLCARVATRAVEMAESSEAISLR